ncbi:PepSY domain-containing protein [Coralloluteibacterium thermophilus]|uniref:PepSY domain-containing protein n=1 Tax=Coralloluteibacterium thermophilum TaxID=2707049 RepID=A0ABV9NIT2_9GAMM
MRLSRLLPASLAAALLTAGGMAAAQPAMRAAEAAELLRAAGHAEVRDLEFDDGLWEADVRRADGRWSDVHIDPATGEILDPEDGRTLLDAAAVAAALEGAGYTAIRDLEREDALWEADALDPQGRPVELRIHGATGAVLHSQAD